LKAAWPGEELSANAGCASFKIKIISGDRRDLSPAERRKGLKKQERLEELGQSVTPRTRSIASAAGTQCSRHRVVVFNRFELGAIFLAIIIADQVTQRGESTWFEGLQLLAIYAVLGPTFFFVS
jgi:hypothetical protein